MIYQKYLKLFNYIKKSYEHAEAIELDDGTIQEEFSLEDFIILQKSLLDCLDVDILEDDGEDGGTEAPLESVQKKVVNGSEIFYMPKQKQN